MEFVTKPSSRLLCAICQDVYQDPLISALCNHSFCTKCITESLRVEPHCPLCRKYVHVSDLHSNLVLKSLTDELPVFCSHRVLGCSEVLRREALAAHVGLCAFRPMRCQNAGRGCSFEGSGVAVAAHKADCVFELMRPILDTFEARFDAMQAVIDAQQIELAKLRKQIANAPIMSASTPSGILDDEEEIILPKTVAFPHGQNIECRRTISDNKTGVTALAYTSSNTLISGAYDGSLKLFNAETGKMSRSFKAHDLSVWAIATDEPRNRFYSAGSDGKIKVWDLEVDDEAESGDVNAGSSTSTSNETRTRTTTASPIITFSDHQRKVYSLQVGQSANRLYSAASDGKIKIWNTETLECHDTIQAHQDCINSIVLLDSDPTKMVSVSSDRTLKLWDLTTTTLLHTFPDIGSEGLDVSYGGGMLYTSTFDASIVAFEMDTYSRVRTMRGHNWEVWQVKYVDGVLFSGSYDHTIKRWDLKTFSEDLTLKGHKGFVHSFRFGTDCLISAGADKTIKIWK
ncbi:WD40 repeat-like protein [Rhizoclosmatium globosum]|uniref:WD40 repeat-like protein n=1 Tax=Rhizoclosmatium globosum TaxID=329046 RepID=A0A1Y2C8S4_9FUNG|nr:WD40 repeat-like protein [Rhizoclosmatium globosum]|eukprot:ORY43432.1 WD40 repeat-like protein [Rhizoclosmatium globosum]